MNSWPSNMETSLRIGLAMLLGSLYLLASDQNEKIHLTKLASMLSNAIDWDLRWAGQHDPSCTTAVGGASISVTFVTAGTEGLALLPNRNCFVKYFIRTGQFYPELVSPLTAYRTPEDYALELFDSEAKLSYQKVRIPAAKRPCMAASSVDSASLRHAVVKDARFGLQKGSVAVWLPEICTGDPAVMTFMEYRAPPFKQVVIFQRDQRAGWARGTLARADLFERRIKRASRGRIEVRRD